MSKTMNRTTIAIGAGVFVLALGLPGVRAEDTIIEKHVEESHSYKVEQPAPAVVERRTTVEAVPQGDVVTEHTTVERAAPAVVEKRTTVETVPAAPVIERRTTETRTEE